MRVGRRMIGKAVWDTLSRAGTSYLPHISRVEKRYLPCCISLLPSNHRLPFPSNNMIQMQSRCLSHQASIFHRPSINLIKCVTDPCPITSHCLQLTTASLQPETHISCRFILHTNQVNKIQVWHLISLYLFDLDTKMIHYGNQSVRR